MIAIRVNNLFYLQDESPQACIANDDRKSQTRIWHERLRHSHPNAIKSMWKNQTVIGMKLEGSVSAIDCKICAVGKITNTPFPTGGPRTSGALDIIHTDVCGPMRTESVGGAQYFVTFIDDHTRWCEIYFMRNKSEVPQKFVEFTNFAERQTGQKIKAVQSDNGKEYCNSTLDTLFKERGIRHRLTVPHTPE